jgi:VIT1/CCC1 family predicted Fe2+/Mn2+ transporter
MTTNTDDADRGADEGADTGDHDEPQSLSGRLNWLRAGVLGANDGIISTAGLVVGVAGATANRHAIVVAGLAGLVAGALSMAAGEYVSVSTQRDTEKAMLDMERQELREDPHAELDELTDIYTQKGLDRALARQVAEQLTEHDALAAHAEAELHLDPNDLTNPWSAAAASFVSFAVGALLPLLTMALVPTPARVPATFVAVLIALVLTGSSSARMGQAPVPRALVRNVCGGFVAMAVTYGVGRLFGTI